MEQMARQPDFVKPLSLLGECLMLHLPYSSGSATLSSRGVADQQRRWHCRRAATPCKGARQPHMTDAGTSKVVIGAHTCHRPPQARRRDWLSKMPRLLLPRTSS